jgi:catechol 2,3-dioxygenase-like lactoylglutathione lyase family enzyme
MSVKPLHHVSLSVRSLDRSLHFYRDLLGMRVSLKADIADEVHERYLRLPPGAHGRVAVLQVGRPIGAIQLINGQAIPVPSFSLLSLMGNPSMTFSPDSPMRGSNRGLVR